LETTIIAVSSLVAHGRTDQAAALRGRVQNRRAHEPVAPPRRSCHVERNIEPMHLSAIAVHELIGPLQPCYVGPIANDPKADHQSLRRLAGLGTTGPCDLAKDCGRLQAKEKLAGVKKGVGGLRITRLERRERFV
jgi:hypothetical protein